MKKIEGIIKKLAECKPELQDRFQAKEIGIFGSYIRGEERGNSDLDILVEFETPPACLDLLNLSIIWKKF